MSECFEPSQPLSIISGVGSGATKDSTRITLSSRFFSLSFFFSVLFSSSSFEQIFGRANARQVKGCNVPVDRTQSENWAVGVIVVRHDFPFKYSVVSATFYGQIYSTIW